GLLLEDVGAILRRAALRIDRLEHILKNGLPVADVLAALAIELPQNPRLADREHELLVADVHEYALEDFVEVQRFARRVLIVPRERAVLRMKRDGRARVKRVVEIRRATA